MNKANKSISEKSCQLKPKVKPKTVRRLTAQQTVDLIKVHKTAIKKASPSAWDKIEVLFERLEQYESEIKEIHGNVNIGIEQAPFKNLRKYIIDIISEAIETVTCYVNTVTGKRKPPSKIQITAIRVLLSISRCYLNSLKTEL